MRRVLFITLCAVSMAVFMVFPAFAQTSLDQAAQNIESAIQDSMSRAGQQGQPTLGQLGGVQSGSSGSDAGGGAGGGSSGGGAGAGGAGGSSGGSGGCFAPDTLVLMADGTSKVIKDIVVGDVVASWDFDAGKQVTATVLHVYTVQRDAYYVVDGIHVTAEHPFCTGPGQYTEVRELTVGTKVADVTAHGLEFQPVAEFELVQQTGTFHNMTVDGPHTYIVLSPRGGQRYLVHNKGGGCCFLAGTLVLMADGTNLPIEDVEIGDIITSYNVDTGKISRETVLDLLSPIRDHYYIMTFEDGSELNVTEDHPLWSNVNGNIGWGSIAPQKTLSYHGMDTSQISAGCKLFSIDGQWIRVTGLLRVDVEIQTYTLKSVSNTQTFFVAPADVVENEGDSSLITRTSNWFLAHNKGF